MSGDVNLVKYDAMCRAIDAAYEVDEVKDIRDRAIALEYYAKQAHNTEAERRACEIRLRAERKAGQLSAKLETAQGRRTDKLPDNMAGSTKTEALKTAGISEHQAKRWEKLAAVPQEQFDAALADQTAKPSTSGIIQANAPPKVCPVSDEALWVWGRLCDFEQRGLLSQNPKEVLATLTDRMADEVHTLAPRVAAWLKCIGELEPITPKSAGATDKKPPTTWRRLAPIGSLLKGAKK
jgi:hypothetical protein